MKVASQVLNANTGQGVPAVSVIVYPVDGSTQIAGTITDSEGNFTLDNPALDDLLNTVIEFTSIGFNTVRLFPDEVGETVNFKPVSKSTGMNVTVTAAKKLQQKMKPHTGPIAVGSIGLTLIITSLFLKS